MTRKLREVVSFYLDREVVDESIKWLQSFGASRGVPAALLAELKPALNRDRHREAVARIESVIGELGGGDVLEAIASRLEELGPRLRSSSAADGEPTR